MERSLDFSPYSVAEIPTPVMQPAEWSIDPNRAALLVHDMQCYFVDGLPDPVHGEVVANTASVLEWARANGLPVFYTAQPGRMTAQDRGLLRDFWGEGMRTKEADRAILPELAPRPQDTVLTKWRYSAFFRSDLEERLREAGRDQLLVVGVYASVGILATTMDSYTRDIQPFVVGDAVADFTPSGHSDMLAYTARTCARIVTTREVVRHV